MEAFAFMLFLILTFFKLLKLFLKLVRFTGAYMILVGTCIGILVCGFYEYIFYQHFDLPSVVVVYKYMIGGAIGGGIFCLYIFIRNIVRVATGDKKLGIVHHMVDQHRFNQAMKPPKAPKEHKFNLIARRRDHKRQIHADAIMNYGKDS